MKQLKLDQYHQLLFKELNKGDGGDSVMMMMMMMLISTAPVRSSSSSSWRSQSTRSRPLGR